MGSQQKLVKTVISSPSGSVAWAQDGAAPSDRQGRAMPIEFRGSAVALPPGVARFARAFRRCRHQLIRL